MLKKEMELTLSVIKANSSGYVHLLASIWRWKRVRVSIGDSDEQR